MKGFAICFLLLMQFGCPMSESRSVASVLSGLGNNATAFSPQQNVATSKVKGPSANSIGDTNGEFNFLGCWTGEKGGGLDITESKIIHLTEHDKREFKFERISADLKNSLGGALLKIQVNEKLEFLRPYVYLKDEGTDEILGTEKILIRGYESYQDFLDERFSTSEYFYRDSCEKLR